MVAITSMKSTFLPLNSRKEKENAAREQEIICPTVINPAVIKELHTNRTSGIFTRACLKLSNVGCLGTRFISVVNSSPGGMNATLTAYSSGRRTKRDTSTLAAIRAPLLTLLTVMAFRLASSCILMISSRLTLPRPFMASVCSINS